MNAGTPRKPVWLPPELLFIVKGQRRLKLDERQVRSTSFFLLIGNLSQIWDVDNESMKWTCSA